MNEKKIPNPFEHLNEYEKRIIKSTGKATVEAVVDGLAGGYCIGKVVQGIRGACPHPVANVLFGTLGTIGSFWMAYEHKKMFKEELDQIQEDAMAKAPYIRY